MRPSGLTHIYLPSHLLSHLCYHLSHLYVCVYVLTVIGSCLGDEIVQGPRNVAVLVGDQARLNCTVQLTADRVHWRYYSLDGAEPIDIYKSNIGVVEGFEADYDVIVSEEDENDHENHDLIIKELRDDLTGKYDCDLPLAGESAADVVAVSEMTCFPEPGEVTVNEGEKVSLVCQAQFSGYDGPVLMWMDEFNGRPPQDEIREDGKTGAVSNVTTQGSHDQKNLYCWLRFDADVNGKPAPDYTDYCVTHYLVNHAVSGVGFSPDPDDSPGTMQLEVGEEINCTASGRPEPEMRWESSTDGRRVEGSMLTIERHMMETQQHYTCHASNVVNENQYTAQNDVTFYAIAPSAIGAAASSDAQWTPLVVLMTLTLAMNWS